MGSGGQGCGDGIHGDHHEGFCLWDTKFTDYNAQTNRLYLHFLHWPFKHVHLHGLAGKVAYAQFLHDAKEVQIRTATTEIHAALNASSPADAATLELPTVMPPVEIPVIELYLK